jgi:hypothetical protein
MLHSHRIDRVETDTPRSRQPLRKIEARHPHQDAEHAALRLHTRGVAVGAEQAAVPERSQGAATVVFTYAIEDDVEPTRQDTREVFALVVDRRGALIADQSCVVATRGAP